MSEAKGGDTSAAKLLLDRALPALRPVDQPTPLALSEGLGQPGREILAALGSGEITPDQGSKLLLALSALGRVIETDELVKRIEALENRQ
ncbi:MAG: hypothetical protein MUC77_16500 [Chromatiaceae bacterium]|nr:hypothetical protein [Chromatiaceae bacterium]